MTRLSMKSIKIGSKGISLRVGNEIGTEASILNTRQPSPKAKVINRKKTGSIGPIDFADTQSYMFLYQLSIIKSRLDWLET